MTVIAERHVGDLVEWDIYGRGTLRGVVLERGDEQGSAEVDALMGRDAGTGWAEFGALLSIRCSNPKCDCQPDAVWRGGTWLHSANESQVRTPVDDVEVGLW